VSGASPAEAAFRERPHRAGNAEQVVTRIVETLETPATALVCQLDPRRVRPGTVTDDDGEIVVRHRAPDFFAVRGHRRLNAAVRAGETMTPMVLADDSGAGPGLPQPGSSMSFFSGWPEKPP
jgi:uncharacterized ParB-like nuclease family protein